MAWHHALTNHRHTALKVNPDGPLMERLVDVNQLARITPSVAISESRIRGWISDPETGFVAACVVYLPVAGRKDKLLIDVARFSDWLESKRASTARIRDVA